LHECNPDTGDAVFQTGGSSMYQSDFVKKKLVPTMSMPNMSSRLGGGKQSMELVSTHKSDYVDHHVPPKLKPQP
jgi:hypothetical protein